MDITRDEIIYPEKGLVSEKDYELIEKYSIELFKRGSEIADKNGLILVDTKYEFGKKDDKIYLIDEIHTPDSSRYFYKEGYEERLEKGEQQRQLSKEFVREWLIENNFQGLEGQIIPDITDEFINTISERYIELYENITSEKFVKHDIEIDKIDWGFFKNYPREAKIEQVMFKSIMEFFVKNGYDREGFNTTSW